MNKVRTSTELLLYQSNAQIFALATELIKQGALSQFRINFIITSFAAMRKMTVINVSSLSVSAGQEVKFFLDI